MSKTCNKGDVGVAMVIADLTSRGIKVALPISGHLPFDLIAISLEGKLSKVSVKHRKNNIKRGLVISVETVFKNNKGNHCKVADKLWYDSVAVYCPDTGKCYYFLNNDIPECGQLLIRLDPNKFENSKNRYRIKNANDYLDAT